jgi:homoserine kinase type II
MMLRYEADFLATICSFWDIPFHKTRPDLPLAGSPERCEYRMVIEDRRGRLLIVENIAAELKEHKQKIADCLEYLSGQKLAFVHPYLKHSEKETIIEHQGGYWQIGPYIAGIALQRPDYINEGWRGRALAGFLQELRKRSHDIPGFDPSASFSIVAFNEDLMSRLRKNDPGIADRIHPAFAYLQARLKSTHDLMPVHFCHGDLHPLNVIWSSQSLLAVIDWEFLGYKTEAYDAANLVGCLGMEQPRGLTADLAFEFIQSLRRSGYLSDESWKYFFELVLALRFAWLSEWLHRDDPEMVELEMVYIEKLLGNRELLLRSWGLGG